MRNITSALAVSLVFIACNSNDAEITRLKNENSSLKEERAISDSLMYSISNTHNEIDSNLIEIEKKKENISALAKKRRLTSDEKKYILAEMDSINQLLLFNREKVNELDSCLSHEKGNHIGMTQLLEGMDDKNSSSDNEIEVMKSELASISADFSDLFEDYIYKEAENMEMQEQLSSQAKELETTQQQLDMAQKKLSSAWYVIGTKDELKDKGLVLKKGFFDDNNMSENFDKSHFKKINIHDLKEIILDSKKATLVTTHPLDSYETISIKKKVNRLVIINPEKFWSASKYLIIEIE